MSGLSEEQREQQIRDRYAVAANPFARMAIRDLLRLLDAERARADAAEAKVARIAALAEYHGVRNLPSIRLPQIDAALAEKPEQEVAS